MQLTLMLTGKSLTKFYSEENVNTRVKRTRVSESKATELSLPESMFASDTVLDMVSDTNL